MDIVSDHKQFTKNCGGCGGMVLTLLEESIWGSDATALAVLLVMSANVRMLLVCASGLHAKKGLIGQP